MSLTPGIDVEVLSDQLVEIDPGQNGFDLEILLSDEIVNTVELDTKVVEVFAGIQGPPGSPGPAGDAGNLSYEVTIAVASTVWEGDHTLGFVPGGVLVKDQTGRFRTFVIDTLTTTHYKIEFFNAMIGTLILS